MEDPEIAAILSDPIIRNFLTDMQGGGDAAQQAQKTMQVRAAYVAHRRERPAVQVGALYRTPHSAPYSTPCRCGRASWLRRDATRALAVAPRVASC
jgi:hypothetical protein